MTKQILLLLLAFAPLFSKGQIITTVAGMPGISTYSGDGAAATLAGFANLNGLAADHLGNIYISDRLRVRKVDNFGIVTTIAGNGVSSGPVDTGDGRAATSVSFFYDRNVGVDFAGNIFFDCVRSIRKISTTGILSTIISSANGGNFVGLNGPATSAGYAVSGLSGSSLWVDSAGQLFYADSCHCIRKIGTDGVVRIVAGRGCFDTSFIDGAAATATGLGGIYCITTDAAGAIYFTTTTGLSASTAVGRVVKIGTDGVVHLQAGIPPTGYTADGSPASSASLSGYLRGIAVDRDSNVYFVETQRSTTVQSGLVRKISKRGILTTVAGILDTPGFSGDGGPATAAKLGYDVTTLAINANGDLYINDLYNNCVRIIKRSTLQVENATPMAFATLSVTPNPAADGSFTLGCKSKNGEDMDITITAMDGRQVLHLQGNTRELVPIQLPQKGIYLVTVDLPGQRITQRVTVE